MSHYLVQAVNATPNIDVRTGTEVVGGAGEGRLQQLVIRENATGDEATVAADALFVLIGARPHTDWLPAEIARDTHGFLLTGTDIADDAAWPLERQPLSLETSLPGVLAAGDVRQGPSNASPPPREKAPSPFNSSTPSSQMSYSSRPPRRTFRRRPRLPRASALLAAHRGEATEAERLARETAPANDSPRSKLRPPGTSSGSAKRLSDCTGEAFPVRRRLPRPGRRARAG